MEFTSLLLVGVVSLIIFFFWEYSCLSYYIRWLTIYVLLQWRSFTAERLSVPLFCSKREEFLEKPRVWSRDKTFRRDSMLVFAASQDVWLLLEIGRGRHETAAVRLRVRLGSSGPIYETSEQDRLRPSDGWTTDCLALQCLEPMRRWRIVFNGRLHCKSGGNQKETKLVRINLIWAALSGPYHYRAGADISTLTSLLAKQPLSHLQLSWDSLGAGYEQWGSVRGTVSVADSPTDIHAVSLRRHSWKWPYATARTSVVGIADDGTLFSMTYSFAKIRTQLGHARYPDGRVEFLEGNSYVENHAFSDKFVRTFKSSCYDHLAYFVCRPLRQWGAMQWASGRCTLDSQQAVCLVLSWNRSLREDLGELPLLTHLAAVSEDLVLPLDHPVCRNPAVVGGKGASLALLHVAAQSVLKNKVVMPGGFCLTIHAMQLHAQSSESLSSPVKFLSLVSSGREKANLQEECQHVVSAWLSIPLCSSVVAALTHCVSPGQSYAVRSSAIGEDCEDTSAAGQNATVLGCVGLDAVIAAVHKCWASTYTFQSVQYRRQSGLPIECAMGVVVQEMVEAEAAGVMFTRHPLTADPARLLITANYGLGETVVSGCVEPDTIVVNTETTGQLFIETTNLGTKDTKLTVTDEGNVKVEAVKEELAESLCLSEPEIIALAQVGVHLEQLFGWPRDIEWAINKGIIYLLQCRPITSLFAWSQEELIHELDSAILPGDATTTANTGEVLPGATSPLCQSTALRCADFLMIHSFAGVRHSLWYNNNKLVTSHHHVLLHLYNTLLLGAKEEPSLQQKVIELAVCGHKVSNKELQRLAAARSTPLTMMQKLLTALHMIKQILVSKSAAKKAQKIGENFKISYDNFTSAASLYAYLTANYSQMLEVFRLHTRVSFASTVWQTILFFILAEGKEELTQENLQDIAKLLVGKQTAISAQIPADIKELTKVIKSCKNWSDVVELAPGRVPAWLEIHCPTAANTLAEIVHRYQHRNIKELDVMTDTWGLDSSPLITMLQTMLRSSTVDPPRREKTADLNSDVVNELKSLTKPLTRRLARWVVGLGRSAAGRREVTKDASLRVVHQFRLGYWRMARLMCEEARLPSADLLFYCTHHELAQLLHAPNPPLIHKISRRQRSWQQWERLQFPEVMTGLPAPVHFRSHPSIKEEESVEGTLVCAGSVQGRACVLLHCTDSHSLQAGDILITHSTDVGWTPLFPLLSGVVTELGGLISHGAVVAREYGLPCVVGATNATLVFKTGDEVYLDGKSGKVQKISSIS